MATVPRRLRLAIDIDSTLHDYWSQLAEVVRRRHGIDLPYEQQHTWEITQLPADQLRDCVRETHSERYVMAGVPYPGAVEAVRRWHEAGHFIHITSHRSLDSYGSTARWLAQIGLPYHDLHCSYDKVTRCVELGIDVLIDDSPVNLSRAAAAGITPATILHPWNRELCRRAAIVCAESWTGLERAIAGLSPAVNPT